MSYLGIPCIGYEGLDTQEICHPDLTVKVGDLQHAKRLVNNLKENKEFYNRVSDKAKELYNTEYKEEKWLARFKSMI